MAWLSAGSVLWLLAFCGFAINYVVRININIAIVAMVKQRANAAGTSGYCVASNATQVRAAAAARGNAANGTALERLYLDNPVLNSTALPHAAAVDEDGRYDWDEYQQGLVLGAFFWLYWTTQVPGGVLSRRLGPKLIFGASNLSACLLAALTPLAAGLHYRALVALRALQGVLAGLAWPSMYCMTANWVPPNDRSKFMSVYLGTSVGAALTFPASAALIGWLGWPAIFYATALVAAAWFLAWWLLVFDHPHHHPRISRSELQYLQVALADDAPSYKAATPWGRILTSPQVWLLVLVKWGSFWAFSTLMTQAPSYLRNIHGWSIGMVGLLSGIPHLGRTAFALLISWLGDLLLKKEVISRPYLRRVVISSYMLTCAVLLAGLAYSGCNHAAAAALLMAAVCVNGALSTGTLAAFVDVSPSYCSIVTGLTNVICTLPGFISPTVVGMLTYQNQTPAQWRTVFLITAAMSAVPGVLYALLGNAARQPWDQLPDQAGNEAARPLRADKRGKDPAGY